LPSRKRIDSEVMRLALQMNTTPSSKDGREHSDW
jgi:hypothetical protein